VLIAALAACSLTPPYERPAAPVAATWPQDVGAQAPSASAAADLPWQQFVQDAPLRELIQLALDNNRDLRVAVQNIEQARAQYQIRRADQFPTVAASAGLTRSAPNPYAALGAPNVSSVYTVGIGVSGWELDLFGRVAALKDAALASYLATEEARKAAQISLIAAVSTAWLQLHGDTELLRLAERTLSTREQSLRLTRLRLDNGAASALDMRLAESLSAAAQVARAQQLRLRAQDINLLTLLVGQPVPQRLLAPVPAQPEAPGDAAQPGGAELPAFADVPAGLPSDLLLRRPDIRAAEQQLIGANANIGAARANFFPRISLTASLGRISSDLGGLFGATDNGAGAWSFGPAISLPLFDAGRNQAGLDVVPPAAPVARCRRDGAGPLPGQPGP
jgi:multidrug efflux system outer membrane protein